MFETIDRQNASLKVFGYCDKDNEALLRLAQEGEYERLRSLKGEYTLIYEEDHRCTIVSSPVGAMHYFYTLPGTSPPGFHHGRSIAGILSKARLEWRWNWQALGDLCQLENLTGTASLHPDIKRVPPGTILQFSNGRLRINSKSLIESLEDQPADPHKAVEALNREVARIAGEQPFLSLSGGFDSRVILSSMLRQGIKPHLITMGNDSCSDVQVARAIAHRFGLEHKLVRITLDDFLSHAPAISRLTNGTKTAWHWHTYLYPLKASIPEKSSFFVGTLGEFARTYYFDRGQLGRLADRFPQQSLSRFWRMKLRRHPTFLSTELSGLAPGFANELDNQAIEARSARLTNYCHGSFLAGLTRYYLEQRVPNFYANGIAMYQASSQWRSPFHTREWMQEIWNLKAGWKLGSNWHRFAISTNYPALLEFPEENGFRPQRMLSKAPPLYWTPFMRRTPYVSYDQSSQWYRLPAIQDSILSSLTTIDDLVEPATVKKIISEHNSGNERTRSLAFLLTMIHWKRVLQEK